MFNRRLGLPFRRLIWINSGAVPPPGCVPIGNGDDLVMKKLFRFPLPLALLLAAACGGDGSGGATTAEVEKIAKERVRQSLGLTADSTLFSKVFVGEPANGETVLCGVVEGKRADGSAITPRRFIVGTEDSRWLLFGPANEEILPSQPDKFLEWHTTCAGQEAI